MQAQDRLRDYFGQEAAQNTLKAAYEAVINQAVADGVITQEQAATILDSLNSREFGMGGKFGGFGEMRGHFGGHGDFGGMRGEFGGECGGPGLMGIE